MASVFMATISLAQKILVISDNSKYWSYLAAVCLNSLGGYS
ncbi:Hypothetical protein I595_267 [Croceitalea dokdonensis DOKDO 023]|uniref:Uncharacterized protein n=1 Tax=Croceitalea dokdonensis DOKDO 023 TaxID=1300341 RepID=A0A0N8H4H2_9FLAO|nr:Hypothetical protein I595_267 [Croceitalea dokdonensis DOKDO 023]